MKRTPSLLCAVTAAICRQSCRNYEAFVPCTDASSGLRHGLVYWLSNLRFPGCFLANELSHLTLSDAAKQQLVNAAGML